MTIHLPERFSQKLQDDTIWNANVSRTIANVEEYYCRSPYFFPEYTIHGSKHVNNVLEISDRLIPIPCMDALDCRDLGIFILSVLLHDIGMFLEKEGLHQLISGRYKEEKIPDLDEYSWQEEWERYLNKVRRYPDKVLLHLFGSAAQIQIPPADMSQLRPIDILVYGDFLRQFHPRLAHQMALSGFMGQETMDLFQGVDMDREIRELTGLLVRSHGIALRDAYPFLSDRYLPPQQPKGIPIFYLMSLLRIADHLDAGQGRAPRQIQAMDRQFSPASQAEWNWNQAIDYHDYLWDRPKETLFIHAQPQNTVQYQQVKNWLLGIQRELDLCWAVLGEYYGQEQDCLLSIRRVNSNVTDPKTKAYFEQMYVTRPVGLTINPDILELLIGPLYDNNPSCGVRELVQNAVDACRERRVKEQRQHNLEYKGKVEVIVDTREKYLLVCDNGIGMAEDTLIDYYLTAGSSYRNSDQWADAFIVDQKSTVPRTGKFGIGVLSAFLLGSRIHVETRSVDKQDGLFFDFKLGDSMINVSKSRNIEVGTKIKIQLTDKMLNQLADKRLSLDMGEFGIGFTRKASGNFDDLKDEVVQLGSRYYDFKYRWYYGEEPSICYTVDGSETVKNGTVPDGSRRCPGWFSLEGTDFPSYQWTYRPLQLCTGQGFSFRGDYNPLAGGWEELFEPLDKKILSPLYCNGIMIPYSTYPDFGGRRWIPMPTVSVTDYENRLKVSLDRNTCEVPAIHLLYMELCRYLIASLLSIPDKIMASEHWSLFKRPDFIFYQGSFTLEDEAFLRVSGIDEYYTLSSAKPAQLLKNLKNVPFKTIKKNRRELKSWKDFIECLSDNVVKVSGERELEESWLSNMDKTYNRHKNIVVSKDPLLRDIMAKARSPVIAQHKIRTEPYASASPDAFAFFYKEGTKQALPESDAQDDLGMVIEELLHNDVWIPMDRKAREKKYAYAFERLRGYMEHMEDSPYF